MAELPHQPEPLGQTWFTTLHSVAESIGIDTTIAAIADIDKLYDKIKEEDIEIYNLLSEYLNGCEVYSYKYFSCDRSENITNKDIEGLQSIKESNNLKKKILFERIDEKNNNDLEYHIRKTLGQEFVNYSDYLKFKRNRGTQSEHLRFDMTGQRDGDAGLDENIVIFKLFNLPITLRSSYDYQNIIPGDHNHIFIFHKGCPLLYRRGPDGELDEVDDFGGYGTVDILKKLILKFSF